ncbi:MAG TPA: DUF2637 domain-containing protein [Kineosporiaceae bacterium]|nr:DUF2637 domain-containing protein [Kineosporiaceae bacterium]
MSGDSKEVTVTVLTESDALLANSVQTSPGQPRTAPDHGNRWWARDSEDGLPEGVLRKIGPAMAGTITAVAVAAMAEAGFNLANFVSKTLHLPSILAVLFPLIFESTAASFAIQDMRDRRQGHPNAGMRAATYGTLITSAVVNGVVGREAYGSAGLLEVVPPLVLALVIHLHGDRANRAYHSRAVLRPEWRQQQLRKAQVESVSDVLPLLTGDSEHGQATVDLLRRRLDSVTLEPGEALIAAGWHERETRDLDADALRRLETVAATVWGPEGAPAKRATFGRQSFRPGGSQPSRPAGPALPEGDGLALPEGRRPALSEGALPAKPTPALPDSKRPALPEGGGSSRPRRSKQTDEELVDELVQAVQAGDLDPWPTGDAVATFLRINRQRAGQVKDKLHAQLQAGTPPRLTVLPGQATPAPRPTTRGEDTSGMAADA